MSISGNSTGMPGEQSEYILHSTITTNAADEYCVLLIDSKSVIQEISRERIDIGPVTTVMKPIIVDYPNGFEGALGLCVVTDTHPATLFTTLSIGVKDAINTVWPDISTYPIPTNKSN